ncbi:ParB/RepB/Spo0J family partition protein [Inquilinus sp. NPDC058860]|uniref:ParB/RepB/Spo0J family partition protein n=1 Tax=Inquilinus sp. NPDC058860 TaxID=3346652 RepID=UPI00368A2363
MSKFASLVSDIATAAETPIESGKPLRIPIDKIAPDPDQPRKSFDDLDQLAASFKAVGVMQPIRVRPANGEGVHIIVAGERRWRAASMAGLTEIDAFLDTDDDAAARTRQKQVVENEQRQALNPEEMASFIGEQLGGGLKLTDIAKATGIPKAKLSQYAAILQMPPFLRELAPDVALRALYDLFQVWKSRPELVEAYVSDRGPDAITYRSVQILVDSLKKGGQAEPPAAAPQEPAAEPRTPASLPAAGASGPSPGGDSDTDAGGDGEGGDGGEPSGPVQMVATDGIRKRVEAVFAALGFFDPRQTEMDRAKALKALQKAQSAINKAISDLGG